MPNTLSVADRQAKVAEYLSVPPLERQTLERTIENLQSKHPQAWQDQLSDKELVSAAKLGYPTFEAIEQKLSAYKTQLKRPVPPGVVQQAGHLADDAANLAIYQGNQRLLDAARPLANADLIMLKAARAFPDPGAVKAMSEMLSTVYTKQGAGPAASPEAIRAAGVYSASVHLLEEAARRGAPVTAKELGQLKSGALLNDALSGSYRRTLQKVIDRFEVEAVAPSRGQSVSSARVPHVAFER